jgi:UDP-glucose 4-epimerase
MHFSNTFLLTGGLGYIGSYIAYLLLMNNNRVVILDYDKSKKTLFLRNCIKLNLKAPPIYCENILNSANIEKIIIDNKIDTVIHCAGLKSISDSIKFPLEYYQNNVMGTLSILNAMKTTNIKKIIFSSSASVYGNPKYLPIDETHTISPISPYGRTKSLIEFMLRDLAKSEKDWHIISLRYFNVFGSHSTGILNCNYNLISDSLFKNIYDVAEDENQCLKIYKSRDLTFDGSCIRDFIHIDDLSKGHISSVDYLNNNPGWCIFNLGTGVGSSILEVVNSFNKKTKKNIIYNFTDTRNQDISISYAKVEKALTLLNWKSKILISDINSFQGKF